MFSGEEQAMAEEAERLSVFTPSDLYHIAPASVVDKTIQSWEAMDLIAELTHKGYSNSNFWFYPSIYVFKKFSSLLNEYIAPNVYDIATCMLRADPTRRFRPTVERAENIVGISTQVPINFVLQENSAYGAKYEIIVPYLTKTIDITLKRTNHYISEFKVDYSEREWVAVVLLRHQNSKKAYNDDQLSLIAKYIDKNIGFEDFLRRTRHESKKFNELVHKIKGMF